MGLLCNMLRISNEIFVFQIEINLHENGIFLSYTVAHTIQSALHLSNTQQEHTVLKIFGAFSHQVVISICLSRILYAMPECACVSKFVSGKSVSGYYGPCHYRSRVRDRAFYEHYAFTISSRCKFFCLNLLHFQSKGNKEKEEKNE